MRTIDLSPLYRSLVGFDRLAAQLDAALSDGLLSISLKRELPEALKPRTIAINTGDAQSAAPLIEGEKVKGSKAA